MRILQVASSLGQDCGIALFATRLDAQLRRKGLDVRTVARAPASVGSDVVLVQFHEELDGDLDLAMLADACHRPVILFTHSTTAWTSHPALGGVAAMSSGLVQPTSRPVHLFTHPAWTPHQLEERTCLRREFGMPEHAFIVGTNGFLRFERQFDEIVEALLPEATAHDWFIEVLTSPWRLDSPGLIPRLQAIRDRSPGHFHFHHGFMAEDTLNRRLQACDLLWCWTAAPSEPYASGTIADQYASGTRVIATDKVQHEHVLGLPNTVRAPATFDAFVAALIAEIRCRPGSRHDPVAVSWDRCLDDFVAFIHRIGHAS
jgi:hypothetical protein